MKNLLKSITIFSLFILPGFAMAQSMKDSTAVLQKCIDLPELTQYYPLDDAGNPVQIYVMTYPVSFPNDMDVSKFGESLVFNSRTDINEKKVEAYFAFRHFKVSQETALINLNYFYNYNFTTKQFKMLSVNVELQKVDNEWSVSNTNLKGDTK